MPLPILTERLTLLSFCMAAEEQLDGLVAAWDDSEAWRYVGAGRDAFTRADLARALEGARASATIDDELLVVRTDDGAVLGTCGLYPSSHDGGDPDETDLGYRYGRAFWGQGYGLEAAKAVLRWAAQERGLTRLGSNVQAPNVASQKILRHLGFTYVDSRPVPSDPSRSALWFVWEANRAAMPASRSPAAGA